jgi:hypothetical protein
MKPGSDGVLGIPRQRLYLGLCELLLKVVAVLVFGPAGRSAGLRVGARWREFPVSARRPEGVVA